MRSSVLCLCGALLILLGLVPAGEARTLVLKENAPFREGPAKTTPLLGDLAPGVTVEVLEESAGWLKVTVPDGRTGYIWAEHTSEPGAEPPKGDDDQATAGSGAKDPTAQLRADIAALRARPEPVRASDIEALRSEIARLAEAQRELGRRLGSAGGQAANDPPASPAAVGWLGVGIGLIVGWFAALIVARRREHRSPNRLRL